MLAFGVVLFFYRQKCDNGFRKGGKFWLKHPHSFRACQHLLCTALDSRMRIIMRGHLRGLRGRFSPLSDFFEHFHLLNSKTVTIGESCFKIIFLIY